MVLITGFLLYPLRRGVLNQIVAHGPSNNWMFFFFIRCVYKGFQGLLKEDISFGKCCTLLLFFFLWI